MVGSIAHPTISVIIPTYNCEQYIVQAIESVLAQKDCEYEVIVIDDGSTDRTENILEPYNEVIRYLKQKNQGVAAARNRGIAEAKGELIAFLDADDYFLPGKLAAQSAIFAKQANLGIVNSGWLRVSSQGEKLLEVRPWEKTPQLNLEDWLQWRPVLPSAMMFRREWLEYVGGFDGRFPPAEDTELVLRLAYMGCQSAWLKRVTVCYRQHDRSAMYQGLPQARSLTAVIEHFFAQPNLPEKVRLMEHSVRYLTFVWIAWYLYYTSHRAEMVEYLKQAWYHTPLSPIETVINWTECFAEFSQNWGVEFDAHELAKSEEWQSLMQWAIRVTGKADLI